MVGRVSLNEFRVLILGSHPHDAWSMRKYTQLLASAYQDAGLECKILVPSNRISRRVESPSLRKWVAYFESNVLFPFRVLRERTGGDLVHVSDHSNALWLLVPGLRRLSVVTCHDLFAVRAARGDIPEHQTRFSGRVLQSLIARGLCRANLVECVSDATRRDLLRQFGEIPCAVVHNPVRPEFSASERSSQRVRNDRRRMLVVSTIGWRKRRSDAISLWLQLREHVRLQGLRLLVVGPPMSAEEEGLVGSSHPDVACVSDITDGELVDAYRDSLGLIQVSRYEGFGWPVVEANSLGVPAVCADLPVLREVGGEGAAFVPDDFAHVDWDAIADWLLSPESVIAAIRNARRFEFARFSGELRELAIAVVSADAAVDGGRIERRADANRS